MPKKPVLVFVVSGKRKSGKDFICSKLVESLGNIVKLITLSAPLKQAYANENNLDFKQLLSSSDYKEAYRMQMIKLIEHNTKK